MSNGKAMIICLIIGLIKKTSLYKMGYFSQPNAHSKNKIKVELDFLNYATKSDLQKSQALIHQNLPKILV